MKLEIKTEKDYTHITIHGEIDLFNSNEFKEKVHLSTDRAVSPNLIIDLKDVEYILILAIEEESGVHFSITKSLNSLTWTLSLQH